MNEDQTDVIYDRFGEAKLRVLSDDRIVTFQGKSLGFKIGNDIFNYHGRYIGYYEGGVLRDKSSKCVGFGEIVTDLITPYFPYKQYNPFPQYVEYEPHRPFPEYVPHKPHKSHQWSEYSPVSLFLINL